MRYHGLDAHVRTVSKPRLSELVVPFRQKVASTLR